MKTRHREQGRYNQGSFGFRFFRRKSSVAVRTRIARITRHKYLLVDRRRLEQFIRRQRPTFLNFGWNPPSVPWAITLKVA